MSKKENDITVLDKQKIAKMKNVIGLCNEIRRFLTKLAIITINDKICFI